MKNARILIVDDDEMVTMVFQDELQYAGYKNVETALSGMEAIEKVKAKKYDLIYSDLMMPQLNGIDVCREVKKISPETEIILISGHPGVIDKFRNDIIKAGGSDLILTKPLDTFQLTRVTNNFFNEQNTSMV